MVRGEVREVGWASSGTWGGVRFSLIFFVLSIVETVLFRGDDDKLCFRHMELEVRVDVSGPSKGLLELEDGAGGWKVGGEKPKLDM